MTQPGVELTRDRHGYTAIAQEGRHDTPDALARADASPCAFSGGAADGYFDALVQMAFCPRTYVQGNGHAARSMPVSWYAVGERKVSYGEMTCFGDTRYSAAGRQTLSTLDAVADSVFRSRLKMPADVYEGPAMNHSYHEMIIGYGRGFSTILLADKQEALKRVQYTADYHRAQWLATQKALAQRAAPWRDDDSRFQRDSRNTLREFFSEVRKRLPRRRA